MSEKTPKPERTSEVDIADLVTKGYPKELTEACLKDEKCNKKLLDRYAKSLEIGQMVKYESKEMEKVADLCLKDEECKQKAVGKYLTFLNARNSKEVLNSVDKGVNIAKTIAIAILVIAILIAVYIFIRTVLDPTFIQGMMDQLTDAISHMFDGVVPTPTP